MFLPVGLVVVAIVASLRVKDNKGRNRVPRSINPGTCSSRDLIEAMDQALEGAVATLPDPVSSMRVQTIAESILRCAKDGERDPRTLQTMALVEMQIRSDE
jgi:hypothetical protein